MHNRYEHDALMNVEQAAQFLNVSTATVRRHTKIGEIPHVRIGAALRFHRPTLECWLEAQSFVRAA